MMWEFILLNIELPDLYFNLFSDFAKTQLSGQIQLVRENMVRKWEKITPNIFSKLYL